MNGQVILALLVSFCISTVTVESKTPEAGHIAPYTDEQVLAIYHDLKKKTNRFKNAEEKDEYYKNFMAEDPVFAKLIAQSLGEMDVNNDEQMLAKLREIRNFINPNYRHQSPGLEASEFYDFSEYVLHKSKKTKTESTSDLVTAGGKKESKDTSETCDCTN